MSILVPCYHAEAYACDAIESALAQDYPHIEVIVIPDDSGTYSSIRDRVRSSRLKLLRPHSQPGRGAALARNMGIDHAEGDYFLALDADDLLEPGIVSSLMSQAMRFGGAVAPTAYVTFDGEPIRTPPMPPGFLTIAGYGQQLASLRPLIHRRFEVGYRPGFAEDTLHDLHVLAAMGDKIPVVTDSKYLLRERAGSACNALAKDESPHIKRYEEVALLAEFYPTELGLQSLGKKARMDIAEAFRFRAYVSKCYAESSATSYNRFVGGSEASFWDSYLSIKYENARSRLTAAG